MSKDEALLPVTPEDIEFLARITEAGGNKAAAFTLRSVGAVGIVLEAQAQVIAAHRQSHSLPGDVGIRKFALGDRVSKKSGANWNGRVVGFYSTALTTIGYAVESEREIGSVQIYPEAALTPSALSGDAGEGE